MAGNLITIYDRYGKWLDDLPNSVTSIRTWVLNDFGRADCIIATSDPHFIPSNFQLGNLIRIQHIPSVEADGTTGRGQLPDWFGVIQLPSFWNEAAGSYQFTAYTGEFILKYRAMPFVAAQGTQAALYRQMLGYANTSKGTIIQPGTIEDDKAVVALNLSQSFYDHMKDLVTTAAADWDVAGNVDANGKLSLSANLYNQKGHYTGQALSAGLNVQMKDRILTEQGELVNHVFGYGSSFQAGLKPKGDVASDASIEQYGEWSINTVFGSQTGGIEHSTYLQVLSTMQPQVVITPTALDVGLTFQYLEAGNIWDVALPDVGFYDGVVGFNGRARILSVKYDDLANTAELQVKLL